ncbi:MAG: 1-acyl-sn-glycerol-3-phosphate acyltransferase [Spirochaetales bacterium]|nr:1-acyl-sn-glycerol-3-phosphate acyltransferase [Spirochaetales bacterium]
MDFSDIRSYPEKIFSTYWHKVIEDPHFKVLLEHLSRHHLNIRNIVSSLKSHDQFRSLMIQMVELLVMKTVEDISFSGTAELKKPAESGSIFISNHRSTSLDPILFNYMLHGETGNTAYNAAGDNLLNTSWLGHLIRLNRGFIVKRNVGDMDQKLHEAEKLSHYIRSLVRKGGNVWIAQRNGRAKDGDDRTDSAVLAMLKLSHKEKSWEEFSREIPLVPVSMSYEEIPLDTLIVRDHLGMTDTNDSRRDSGQILQEIGETKRKIHIHISPRVIGSKRAELVKKLDDSIISGTKIWESNNYAARLLHRLDSVKDKPVRWLKEKLSSQDELLRHALIKLYAAPVINRMKLDNP